MEEIVNLPGLARGAAVELWAEELKKVAANILDVNTDPKAAREITLKATILPNEDRTNAMVSIAVTSKLASFKPATTIFYLARRSGAAVVVESNPDQMTLLKQDEPARFESVQGGKD
jgi:hypothetical protein